MPIRFALPSLTFATGITLMLVACTKNKPDAGKSRPTTEAPASSLELGSPLLPKVPPAAGETVHGVGELAAAPFYKMRIEKVQECKVRDYFAPAAGSIKLGVDVTLEGTADKDVPVNPFYAKLTDSEGYSWTSTLAGCTPDLKSMRINSGDSTRGWITFEIPKSATGLKLTYSPFIVGSAKQELVFDLGR
jgi:hypothetical protein